MTSGGLAAVTSSFFAALYSAFGKYDVVHIHAEGPAFFSWLPKMFGKRVVVTIHGIDWQREKWQSGLGSKFIHQGEKNAVKYADEVIVLSKGLQDYFKETYGRKTHFIPNGVNPFIAIGKITLLQGDPGDGKSTLMMNLIAELSTGGKTPDGCKIGVPQKVIYQCSEDGVSDTIKPRLERCGADCRKIAFINEEVYNGLTLDDERMLSVFLEVRPISAFCRGKIGSLLQSRRVLRSIPCPLRFQTGC